jgi:hypothetical protein
MTAVELFNLHFPELDPMNNSGVSLTSVINHGYQTHRWPYELQ